MVIAVNTRFLIKNKLEGIGWFTYESLKRITQSHPEHSFHFIFDREFDKEFVFSSNVTTHIIGPQARHPLLWYYWFEFSLPALLKKINPDIFLSTDGYLSLKANSKQVLVIHDLAFEHTPEHIDPLSRFYYKYFTPRYARKAQRIATVSQFSKDDISSRYHIPPEKIDVVYNGANEFFHPAGNDEKEKVRKRYTQGMPYFIYAGAIQPRKNVDSLFKAFDQFKEKYKTNHKLIIAGRFAWKTNEIKNVYAKMKHKQDVIFTGHLGRADLTSLIGASEAMVYISLFEGFGIPIVEALQCEVPVITSNVSSMPEVAGKAGILVNPLDINSIAEAMHSVTSDINLRQNSIAASKEQLKLFSWDLTAARLWQTILSALKD